MTIKRTYGLWDSPLSADMLSGDGRLNDVQWDSDGKTLVWSERGARGTVLMMQRGTDAPRALTDSSHKIGGRTLYGGGDFTVHEGLVYFVSHGRLHRVALEGGVPQPITPRFGGAAAPAVSADGQWLAFAHSADDVDVLAVTRTDGTQWPQIIAQGTDFVAAPAWHPAGKQLAYLSWDHPQMPFTGTQLHLLEMAYGGDERPYVTQNTVIAGDANTAIFQPQFSPDGRYLSYISDASGYTHLYLYDLAAGTHAQITSGEFEHGVPMWINGLRMYGWTQDSSAIYYLRHVQGVFSLHTYDLEHGTSLPLRDFADYPSLSQISVATGDDEVLALIGAAPQIPPRLLCFSRQEGLRVVRRVTTESIPLAYLADAEPLAWQGHDGETAYGLYYAPTNPDFEGEGAPPLIVMVHGGPTSQRTATYYNDVQFFTSRGFAVLQVNHRGSTGYGRAYMDKHQGNWGVYDVQDSITGAQHLVNQGLADGAKLVIMGGSAGGYTALQALVDEPGFFAAAVVSYGVANQFTLAMESHKFEARYNDWLLGPLPQAAEKYRDRSPQFHAEKIQDAVLLFHGTDDEVVPINQSDAIVSVLRRKGVPHEYHIYEGEGHGFRKPANIKHFHETVVKFLMQHVIYA